MFFRALFVAMVASGLVVPGAQAVLKKYNVQFAHISTSNNVSPNPDYNPNQGAPPGRAVIDDSGASPVLNKLLIQSDETVTVVVPDLGGFIFVSGKVGRSPSGEFTGTGSTETTIAWGLLTGWTVTGTQWCNASPAFICAMAKRLQQESSDPILLSTFYDMGTWTFHGTGWTGRPYVESTHEDPGNDQLVLRGVLVQDGTVPAVPVLGLAVLGGSLVLGSLAALRKRNR
jgi:hypothetical protein